MGLGIAGLQLESFPFTMCWWPKIVNLVGSNSQLSFNMKIKILLRLQKFPSMISTYPNVRLPNVRQRIQAVKAHCKTQPRKLMRQSVLVCYPGDVGVHAMFCFTFAFLDPWRLKKLFNQIPPSASLFPELPWFAGKTPTRRLSCTTLRSQSKGAWRPLVLLWSETFYRGLQVL